MLDLTLERTYGAIGIEAIMEHREFKAIGVDGCKFGGWFYVILSPSKPPEWGVVSRFEKLLPKVDGLDRIFVNIPVGLLENKSERTCDHEAQSILINISSSVFSTPVRPVLSADSYEDAKVKSAEACGKALSKQAWAIAPKIREVDSLLRENEKMRHFVREIHSDICFWPLNERKLMKYSKWDEIGFAERVRVLKSWIPETKNIVRKIRKDWILGIERDDIADAMVAAVTALAEPAALRTLPESPPLDNLGLPMEMVYADPDLLRKHPLQTARWR